MPTALYSDTAFFARELRSRNPSGGGSEGGRSPPSEVYFLTKMDLGTMQWTPLRTFTTWVTTQFVVMDANA